MGKPTGFLEYERKDTKIVEAEKRVESFLEFHGMPDRKVQKTQAARCMDCGVAFCQAGVMIAGMASGCPLNNLVPELNDLVYHDCYELAYQRLSMTHSFPEFTSRVCPALCEAACTCGLHDAAVTTKENERSIIEYAFENGLVKEEAPEIRTGKKIAVVGSGPSGLAAAQLLNRRGHSVTVYERSDRIGGLLRYGIPNMKLDKSVIDRRVKLMEDAGVTFITGVNVCGSDITEKKRQGFKAQGVKYVSAAELKSQYDAVILACGASQPRDIKAPGRDTEGIRFAVEFLGSVTKTLLDKGLKTSEEMRKAFPDVVGKDVIVIGGGDTGNDCVGTSIRLGCKSVTQLEMMPKAPDERLASNPWPEWPKVGKTDYGQQEAIYKFGNDPRIYQTTVKEFISETVKNEKGKDVKRLKEVVLQSLTPKKDEKTGRMMMVPVEGSEKTVPAQLVLIAAGFLGSESYVTDAFGVEVDGRTNVKTEEGHFKAVVKGAKDVKSAVVYTAGDMHRGQSLVVWAIAEGRKAAREVDLELMGYTNL